jgi:hypothetical protein
MALIVLLAGCSETADRGASETAVRPTASVSRAVTANRSTPAVPGKNPFAHLADDMSHDCIRSATDPHVARSTVYLRCVGAHKALLNAKTPQPYTDDNAVTASVLEIYAAYALRHASRSRTQEYYALLRDADSRLKVLAERASTVQIRNRAVAARSCLIERDAGCLEQWAHYQ